MKSRSKFLLLILISMIISFVVFLGLSMISGKIWNKGYDLNHLDAISSELIATLEQQPSIDAPNIKSILDNIPLTYASIQVELIHPSGEMMYSTNGQLGHYSFDTFAQRFLNMPENLWIENQTINLAYSITIDYNNYYLLLNLPSDAMKQGQFYFFVQTYQIIVVFLLPLLISFMIPYLTSLSFFNSNNRRIKKLNHALNQLNLQTEMVFVTDNSKDEIGVLTQHYNSMTERIQNQLKQIEQFEKKRKQLLSNLSHDLRTPLTMILGYAETLRNGVYKDEKEILANSKIILQRSRYMEKLLNQLLDVTKQNNNATTNNFSFNNISELSRKLLADYMLLLDGEDYDIQINIEDRDIHTIFDRTLIERAIRNLLDNAIRYGKDGQFLGYTLDETETNVYIRVSDKGKGIASEEQHKIFERFYRTNQARQGEGLGLGLSIVKEIVEVHQGTITISSKPYEETVFILRLPKLKKRGTV